MGEVITNRCVYDQWISVEDRLPEYDVDVLTWDSVECRVLKWMGDRWMCFVYEEWQEAELWSIITHWQPLPSPPHDE